MHHIDIVFNLDSKKEFCFLFHGLGNRNPFWYRDFLGRLENLYHKK